MGWTLTGGGALVGFHLGHRVTRDLDFFWRDRASLDRLPDEVIARLRLAGIPAERQQTAVAFCRLFVGEVGQAIPVDLVADGAAMVDAPLEVAPGLWIDSAHEILVNKLTALLGRWAVRDLVDVKALLEGGGDLERALADAPRKDGGFSPETLAWVLDTTPAIRALSPELVVFADRLVVRLLRG